MYKYLLRFVLCLNFLIVPLPVTAQASSPAAVTKSATQPDYSKEAFVDEDDVTKLFFETDGTGTREWNFRIRIQSDAGLQRYSVLTFPYQSATDALQIDYVRVRKPDGTVITTPADSFQDMPSEITRQAPFYSDLHEEHVAVKGLAVGDVLEASARWQIKKALAPGQFWTAFNFSHDFIILHEEFQVSVPKDRTVKWKSPEAKPIITEEGNRRIFAWTTSQLDHKSADSDKKDQEEKLYQSTRGKLPPADVQLSSFQSWEEIGAWYNGLQLERVKPSADVRAKALELTKNAADDNAKLRAIYNYVSTQYHYIGVAFGIGRYQPHSSDEVLANQYGDCKDKHTLLASLLEAAGIKAYPALVGSMHQLDSDVPSPAQFDHVITAVPQGSGYLWLDSTQEVAPFGYLLSVLRDKPALVIADGKPAGLITTVAQPPSPSAQTFKIDGKLDEEGTLHGKVGVSVKGDDTEVVLRAAFRRVPLTQWKDLVQRLSYASGFAGDVSEVTASSPEQTDEPFHWSYTYNRKDFPEWSERRIAGALPPMLTPSPDESPSHPIVLGSIGEIDFESRVELPSGYSPQLPNRVDLKEDFAEYHSVYSVSNSVLTIERKMHFKMEEVPVEEFDKYKKFNKTVTDDGNTYVAVTSGTTQADSLQASIWNLPASDNAEAMKALEAAQSAARSGDMAGATASLEKAVQADPRFTRAWMMLVGMYSSAGQRDKALATLRKAYEAEPSQPTIYKALVGTLMSTGQYDEAIGVLQKLAKADPPDVDIISSLGAALSGAKRYAEAVVTLESAIKIAPSRGALYAQLGSAYMESGNDDKASETFKKAVEVDSRPMMYNDIAYSMADANKNLPLSLEYAEKAVQAEEAASARTSLSELKKEDLACPPQLAAAWDTLGWVHFRLGNYDKAVKYLNAAWLMTEGSVEADHLGQVYEKQGNKKEAIHMYQYSLAVSPARARASASAETRKRLERLRPGASDFKNVYSATSDLSTFRTLKLPQLPKQTASAEFFVLFAQGSTNAKFVSGSDTLKSADKLISSNTFRVTFPDEGPTHLLRRGVLDCYPMTGCTFVLYFPAEVHSVD